VGKGGGVSVLVVLLDARMRGQASGVPGRHQGGARAVPRTQLQRIVCPRLRLRGRVWATPLVRHCFLHKQVHPEGLQRPRGGGGGAQGRGAVPASKVEQGFTTSGDTECSGGGRISPKGVFRLRWGGTCVPHAKDVPAPERVYKTRAASVCVWCACGVRVVVGGGQDEKAGTRRGKPTTARKLGRGGEGGEGGRGAP
jgi:hypothetical protein